MTTIYKIFNPATGEYVTAETVEACTDILINMAMSILNKFTQDAPYSVVTINEDGSETWRNPQGEEIVNLELLKQKAKAQVGSTLVSIPVTPVETMP